MTAYLRVLASQTITASTGNLKSSAAPKFTRAVRIAPIGQPVIAQIGGEPVAVVGGITLASNDSVTLACSEGEKVGVIRQGAADAPTNIAFLG